MNRDHLDVVRGDYRVSTDPTLLDVEAIHVYLVRSYWAEGIPLSVVERSARGSLCFGLFDTTAARVPAQRQVGFARVVTDRATFAHLCDVYVLEEARGQGLGKWLIEVVTQHPHALHSQYGFAPLRAPERAMEIVRPDVYSGRGSSRDEPAALLPITRP